MSDDEFFAWLDGELDADRSAEMEAQVAASPELTACAAEHRRLATKLQAAFAPVAVADVPPPSFQSADVFHFGARVTGRERRALLGPPQWAAMAATLALGLLVGSLVSRGPYSPVAVDGDRLVAAAALDQALDTLLASAPEREAMRIGLTFRDAQGSICRSFQERSASGLACRKEGQWRIEGLFPVAEGQSADYRMAGQDPRLAEIISRKISGEPFDARQERAARDRGWQ